MPNQNLYKRVCANCGCTYGSHLANSVFNSDGSLKYSKDCCPGEEGRMDWDKGGGTVFKPKEEEPMKG